MSCRARRALVGRDLRMTLVPVGAAVALVLLDWRSGVLPLVFELLISMEEAFGVPLVRFPPALTPRTVIGLTGLAGGLTLAAALTAYRGASLAGSWVLVAVPLVSATATDPVWHPVVAPTAPAFGLAPLWSGLALGTVAYAAGRHLADGETGSITTAVVGRDRTVATVATVGAVGVAAAFPNLVGLSVLPIWIFAVATTALLPAAAVVGFHRGGLPTTWVLVVAPSAGLAGGFAHGGWPLTTAVATAWSGLGHAAVWGTAAYAVGIGARRLADRHRHGRPVPGGRAGEACAAASVRLSGVSPHSVVAGILLVFLVTAGSVGATGTTTLDSPGESPTGLHPDASIQVRKGGCFGQCSQFTVLVCGDGTVHYRGEKYVGVEGHHVRTIPQDRVRNLLWRAQTVDFFQLNSTYDGGVDGQSYEVAVAMGGRSHRSESVGGPGNDRLYLFSRAVTALVDEWVDEDARVDPPAASGDVAC